MTWPEEKAEMRQLINVLERENGLLHAAVNRLELAALVIQDQVAELCKLVKAEPLPANTYMKQRLHQERGNDKTGTE